MQELVLSALATSTRFAAREDGRLKLHRELRQMIEDAGEGTSFFLADLVRAGYGSSREVSAALSKLGAAGVLRHARRGWWCRSIESRFFGPMLPSAEDLARVYAVRRGYLLEEHGANAVRLFRLSTQQPVRPVCHWSGPTMTLKFTAGDTCMLRHLHGRYLRQAGTHAGLAIVALSYLGRDEITLEDTLKVLGQLSVDQRELVRGELPFLPAWLRRPLTAGLNQLADVESFR